MVRFLLALNSHRMPSLATVKQLPFFRPFPVDTSQKERVFFSPNRAALPFSGSTFRFCKDRNEDIWKRQLEKSYERKETNTL